MIISEEDAQLPLRDLAIFGLLARIAQTLVDVGNRSECMNYEGYWFQLKLVRGSHS